MDCICHMEDHPGIGLLMMARGQPTGVPLNADIDFFTLCCNNFLCCINGGDVLSQGGEPLCIVGINPQELLPVSRQICRPILPRLSLAWDFRRFGLYWSQTTSILLAWSSWLLTYVRKTFRARQGCLQPQALWGCQPQPHQGWQRQWLMHLVWHLHVNNSPDTQ